MEWGLDEAMDYDAYVMAIDREQDGHELVVLTGRVARYRESVVEWMVPLMNSLLGYGSEAVFATVRYFDQVLHACHVSKRRVQLVALTCMLVAGKMFESKKVPSLETLNQLAGYQYMPDAILAMEGNILHTLSWKLRVVTPLFFWGYFASFGVCPDEDSIHGLQLTPASAAQYSRALRKVSHTILAEICLLSMAFLDCMPSMTASAALLVARNKLGIAPDWAPRFQVRIGYSRSDVAVSAAKLSLLFDEKFPSGSPSLTTPPSVESVSWSTSATQ